ncbi:unnamed protein product, partial [Coffea canephora]
SNKITEIVRLQPVLNKWKKLAANTSKSVKFLKKTLFLGKRKHSSSRSLTNGAISGGSSDVVPKGYLAVCVGEGLKRFVIPMEDLGHQAFGILLTQAEEEFGFRVLNIPCQVAVFEKMMDERRDAPNAFHLHDFSSLLLEEINWTWILLAMLDIAARYTTPASSNAQMMTSLDVVDPLRTSPR